MSANLCETCAHRGPWRALFAHPALEADCRARGTVVDSWAMPEACESFQPRAGSAGDPERALGRSPERRDGGRRVNWPQIILAALSGAGILFLSQGDLLLGCSLGLAAQPLWVRETYRARQWGMFALSLWYTLAWGNGLVVNLGGL